MTWRDRIPAWVTPVAIALALAALVAWSFAARWQLLAASPFPIGVDGYFYPVQLRSLLEHGHLKYAASPLAFWLMAPFAAATDPITGAKLGAALGGALVAVPAFGVGARLGGHRAAGLVAAAAATTSAGSAYLTVEFVKNGVGLTIALAALWQVLRALERPSRGRLIAMAVAIIAACLTHKMAAAMVFAVGVPAAIAEAIGRGVLRGRRLIFLLVGGLAIAGAVLVLGLLAPRRFLAPDDLGLLGGLVSGSANWDLPALATPSVTLALDGEIVVALKAAVIAAGLLLAVRFLPPEDPSPTSPRASRGVIVASWIVVALTLAICQPWLAVDDPQGLGFRLRLAAFVPGALCAAIACGLGARWLAPVVAWLSGGRAAAWVAPLAGWIVLPLVALALVTRAPVRHEVEGEVVTHPALVSAVMALDGQVSAGDTIIVPERHIAFMVAWYTRAQVSIQPEPIPRERRWRLLPLAFTGADSPLDHALIAARKEPSIVPPLGLHARHANGLVLVAEPTWEWLLAQLPPKAQRWFGGWPTI